MTKKLMVILAAGLALSGCVAVPVYDAPPAYGYYGVPAASVNLQYYRGGPYYGPGYRYRPRYWR